MDDLKAQPFVEPPGGADFHNVQAYDLIQLRGLTNQALHHPGADTFPLKRSVDNKLRDEDLIILRDGLLASV